MDVFFSDIDSYSTSSSEDIEDDDEFFYSGQASCILSNLEDAMGKIDDFFTFEREYVHGDVVCSIHDPSGQTGKAINVEKVVDLESLNGHKMKSISSKKLEKIRSISVGDYVVSDRWLGKAERVVDRVTVVFDDSTKCEFTTMDNEKIVPLSFDLVDDSQPVYFPGQRVKLSDSSIFSLTNWFCGTEKDQKYEGTVCAVDAGFVYVNWLVSGPFGSEGTAVPGPFQRSEILTSLSSLAHSNWQLGDWCVLSGFQEIFVITNVKSKLDVLWQDGTESRDLDSGRVGPVNVIDSHDFWPHQFVLEKGKSDDQENKNWGVVKTVDSKEKTVKVKWDRTGIEETTSAYELIEPPEFSYCHGDVVLGLEESCPIGIVMGCKDGRVEVKWSSGFTSEVAPNEIFRMDQSEGASGTPLLCNETIGSGQDKPEPGDHENDPMAKVGDYTTFNFPRVAIGFLSDFFGSKAYTLLSMTSNSLSREQTSGFDRQEENTLSLDTEKDVNIIETDESKDVPFSSRNKNLEKVEQFQVVSDCSTHHFVDRVGKGSITNQVNRKWLKKVQQEWNILMNDLPEMIYVRVYEERMDLLQAAIVGAPGTPYYDGLFFFDIFLPPEYPQEPPMVHYISGGLRVNPNLYESGRVCLSLLNTWTGIGTETWNPKDSTILQVLLSLQALVLNKNPYFNEAGYDQQVGSVEGEKNSCSYNENVFLLNCKSMIYTLRNPPKHFGALVEEHFRQRYTYILMACKAYLEGVPVGYAFDSENNKPMSQAKGSMGFKIALSKLFLKLIEVFGSKGFDCGDYAYDLHAIV